MTKSRLPTSRIDLLSLRVLVAAIEEGNLAGAARRENIAISAVSRRISDLEQRWGVQLLHRHDRGVRATAAAELVLDRLRTMFHLLDDVVDDVASVGAGERGLVRLHANMTAAAGGLPEQIFRFVTAYPQIRVEMEEATSSDILHAVRVGTCDIGIVSGTVNADGLQLTPWIADELVAVLPAGHVLAERPRVRLEELLDFPFIGLQRATALRALCREAASGIGREINEHARVASFDVAQTMVACGLGVSILPAITMPPGPDSRLEVRPLEELWARRTLALCTRTDTLSAATRLLADHLLPRAP